MQFREIHKQRVIEAVLGGGKGRRFHAYVDGHAADHYTRYGTDMVTTSFGSKTAALTAARNAVDSDIARQSYLRRYEPEMAVEEAETAHKRALGSLDRVRKEAVEKERIWVVGDRLVDAQQCLADAAMRVTRTRTDLELAIKIWPDRV